MQEDHVDTTHIRNITFKIDRPEKNIVRQQKHISSSRKAKAVFGEYTVEYYIEGERGQGHHAEET